MRQVLMFLSLFALGGYALGNAVGYVYVEDWLPKATEKLVKKYYELEAKLKELEERQRNMENRVHLLEESLHTSGKGHGRHSVYGEHIMISLVPLRVRFCDDLRCRVVYLLMPGEKVYVLEERGKWVKVRTERGVEGWSFKRYLGQLEARK